MLLRCHLVRQTDSQSVSQSSSNRILHPEREITAEMMHVLFFCSRRKNTFVVTSSTFGISANSPSIRLRPFATKFVHFTRPPPPPSLDYGGPLYIYYRFAVSLDNKIKLISCGSSPSHGTSELCPGEGR